MAADGDATREIRDHQSSYAGFVTVMKWGTLVALAVAAIVIFIIGN